MNKQRCETCKHWQAVGTRLGDCQHMAATWSPSIPAVDVEGRTRAGYVCGLWEERDDVE